MHRATRSSSTSRTSKDSQTHSGRNIPDIFRSQKTQASAPLRILAPAQAQAAASPDRPPSANMPGTSSPSSNGALPPSLFDLEKVATDIKNTVTAAIADLKAEMLAVAHRVDNVEQTTQTHAAAIRQVQSAYDSQLAQVFELHRHVEDLDNRGRRHNVRVRGVPESVDPTAIQQTVSAIFNDLIERPADSPIDMERAHRALRPIPRDNEPPRDIICCIVSFPLKEEILRKARERGRILYNGAEVKLFQDLSQITLQNRRALRPLLDALRARNIQYRWKFPFGLSASARGRSALLRTPEDLQAFCEQLDLPDLELPDWYALYFPAEPWLPVSLHPSPKAARQRPRHRRPGPMSPNARSSRRDLQQHSPSPPRM